MPATRVGNTLRQAARRAWLATTDLALPRTCVACGTVLDLTNSHRLACEACHDLTLAAMRRPACGRCGRTLPASAIHDEGCARCRTEHFWNIAAIARVAVYVPPLRRTILELKYAGQLRNADYLAELLAGVLSTQPWLPEIDALVPVPMHWLRRLQRRCDHGRELARAAGRLLDLPVWSCIRRTRQTPSQVGVRSKNARFKNIRGVFAPHQHAPRLLSGRTVCIVDNLVTTGATICEVAKAVRRAGARRIYAATVVRTAAPGDPPSNPLWGLEAAGTA